MRKFMAMMAASLLMIGSGAALAGDPVAGKAKTQVRTVGVSVLGNNFKVTTNRHRFQLIQTEPVGELEAASGTAELAGAAQRPVEIGVVQLCDVAKGMQPPLASAPQLLLPGQGAQQVGMGKDLVDAYPEARRVFEEADRELGIGLGETTPDGKFALEGVECLGACGMGPVMQLGKHFYEHLTPEKVDAILDALE